MSVLDIPLRKVLQLFHASPQLRRKILKEDIRADRRKAAGGTRSRGGDFYLPFWVDVKRYVSGDGDLTKLIEDRIKSNPKYSRLYPQLRDGILDLLNAKLRWSNEPVILAPQSAHGTIVMPDLSGIVRVKDALHARVREKYTRVVYPYFSEEPELSDEGGRLGLWAMQQALRNFDPDDMRLIDILRRKFFSPQITPLRGDEEEIFHEKYKSIIAEWELLRRE